MWSLKVSLLPVFAQAGESPDLKKSPVETRQRRMTKDHDGMGTGMGLSFPLWMGKILIFRGGSTAPTQKKKEFSFWGCVFWCILSWCILTGISRIEFQAIKNHLKLQENSSKSTESEYREARSFVPDRSPYTTRSAFQECGGRPITSWYSHTVFFFVAIRGLIKNTRHARPWLPVHGDSRST